LYLKVTLWEEKGSDTFTRHPLGWGKGKGNNTFNSLLEKEKRRWGRIYCKNPSFRKGGRGEGESGL